MKTIRMEVEDELYDAVDLMSQQLHTTQSALITEALRLLLQQTTIQELERRHAEGYARQASQPTESLEWETEQVWGEASYVLPSLSGQNR